MKPLAFALSAAALAAILLPGVAVAQARPDSLTLTCQAARALVLRNGAIVIGTGPYIYDRYVADRSRCAPTQGTRPGFIATRDNPQCYVGDTCSEIDRPSR